MKKERAHIEGQSSMDVVMLNSKGEYKTAENKRNNVVHVRLSHFIGGGDSEEREEEERRHGGDRHRHRLRQPPREYPRHHPQHVAAARRPLQFHP